MAFLFSGRYGNSAKILLRCLALTKLRVETKIVCNMEWDATLKRGMSAILNNQTQQVSEIRLS